MANWTGAARTNYVRISNLEGLKESLDIFPLSIDKHPAHADFYCIDSDDEYGGWPTCAWVETENGDQEVEFSFSSHVMPFVAEGEVLVAFECGWEKLRYLTGVSQAFVRKGAEIKSVEIGLEQIYQKASEELGVAKEDIARCSYQDVPASYASAKPQNAERG
jgi:hypothetical protein